MIIKEGNIYYLSENVTGCFNNECRFTFLSQFDCLSFFFSVKDTDIISPFEKDNEDIWTGDAVEVFISPNGDLTNYIEIEVSPNSVRFMGRILNKDGCNFILEKIKPNFYAQALINSKGYDVNINVPYSVFSNNFDYAKAKLNAFRLDKKVSGEQILYALNPTYCDSFHIPSFFCQIKK